mmetsp:Transcript_24397/g.40074  ORF Transcript_24397/g.40074 Transcript_24397/m.40074 type:complete len:135 (+) Transcript_24397:101-505(+)
MQQNFLLPLSSHFIHKVLLPTIQSVPVIETVMMAAAESCSTTTTKKGVNKLKKPLFTIFVQEGGCQPSLVNALLQALGCSCNLFNWEFSSCDLLVLIHQPTFGRVHQNTAKCQTFASHVTFQTLCFDSFADGLE